MSRPVSSELQQLRREPGEGHLTGRIGWLRAAVLGANDGIVSTASLVVGIAAADATRESILLAGVAGLVAGALSMAAGEYVSVSSQADTERADLALERRHLADNHAYEEQELAAIYVKRGLDPSLAHTVAQQLMAHDALGAHARDELGLSETLAARPLQAALTSAASFALGASLPILTAVLAPHTNLISVVGSTSLLCLATLGALAAWAGGANAWVGAARVTFWSALAMVATALVGSLFGTTLAEPREPSQDLNVIAGSTRAARQPGTAEATSVTASTTTMTPRYVGASSREMLKRRVVSA